MDFGARLMDKTVLVTIYYGTETCFFTLQNPYINKAS
jgi:hypothetical protein